MTLEERIASKIRPVQNAYGTCLEWTGSYRAGYPRMSLGDRTVAVHRLAWELKNGPVPQGLCILHRCDNPRCLNLAHMFLGTKRDNNVDRNMKGRDATGADNGVNTHPEKRAVGARNGRAKLNPAIVTQIRQWSRGGSSDTEIARRTGVSRTLIRQIVTERIWKPPL